MGPNVGAAVHFSWAGADELGPHLKLDPSLFHSRLKIYLFRIYFPPYTPFRP